MKSHDDMRSHKAVFETKAERDRRKKLRAARQIGVVVDEETGSPVPLSEQLEHLHRDLDKAVSRLPARISRKAADGILAFNEALENLKSHPGVDEISTDDADAVRDRVADWGRTTDAMRAEMIVNKAVLDDHDAEIVQDLLSDHAAEAEYIRNELDNL